MTRPHPNPSGDRPAELDDSAAGQSKNAEAFRRGIAPRFIQKLLKRGR